MTCAHSEAGLCPACRADYDEDPAAWLEYGDHPAGIAAWEALRREMEAEADRPPAAMGADDVPL